MRFCSNPLCNVELLKRHQIKFCSNKCQLEYQYQSYIYLWKTGIVNGSKGINTKNISGYLKKYLALKFGDKCVKCGWCCTHPLTKRVPLEIDHIDGNADNNKESNLQLVCPNCHALTFNFRNLNKGKGRKWRSRKK